MVLIEMLVHINIKVWVIAKILETDFYYTSYIVSAFVGNMFLT